MYMSSARFSCIAASNCFAREKRRFIRKRTGIAIVSRWVPVTNDYEGENSSFGGRDCSQRAARSPGGVETTDLLFAVDSSRPSWPLPGRVHRLHSNVFAILGLRSMYFALAGMDGNVPLPALRPLGCSGVCWSKMLLSHYYEVPTVVALGGLRGFCFVSRASLLKPNSA